MSRRGDGVAFDNAVRNERLSQDRKWGPKPAIHSPRDPELLKMLAVIAEEFGEIARAVLELRAASIADVADPVEHLTNLRDELVQTAACCRALWEQLPASSAEDEAPFFARGKREGSR